MSHKSKEEQSSKNSYWQNITHRTDSNGKTIAYWGDDTRPLYDFRHWNGERLYFIPHGLVFTLMFYLGCVAPFFLSNVALENQVQPQPATPTVTPLPQLTATPPAPLTGR